MRIFSSETLAALQADSATERVFLLKLDFSSGPIYMSTGSRDLVHDGQTWEAVGGGLTIGSVEESGDLKGQGIDLVISGVDPTLISVLLGQDFRGREVRVWQAILDPVSGTVVEAIDLFDGLQLDGYEIEEKISRDGQMTATIRTRGRHRLSVPEFRGIKANVHSHQEHFPGDTFFAHAARYANVLMFWGTPSPTRLGSGGTSRDGDGEGGGGGPGDDQIMG